VGWGGAFGVLAEGGPACCGRGGGECRRVLDSAWLLYVDQGLQRRGQATACVCVCVCLCVCLCVCMCVCVCVCVIYL